MLEHDSLIRVTLRVTTAIESAKSHTRASNKDVDDVSKLKEFEMAAATADNNQLMKTSDARSLLLARPWWNLCFVHGDQTKYYRQLYGKRRPIRTLQNSDAVQTTCLCETDGNSTLQRKQ